MKIVNKWFTIIFAFLFLTIGLTKSSKAQQQFDKAAFYKIMETGNLSAINSQIEVVKASATENKAGYEGALLMRKAGKEAIPQKKLKYFKEGRIKLETAIQADADNAEYRFLRLTIEENAPKIVKYRNDLEEDKAFIQRNFKRMLPVIQHAIMNYSKNSKILHTEDFLTL